MRSLNQDFQVCTALAIVEDVASSVAVMRHAAAMRWMSDGSCEIAPPQNASVMRRTKADIAQTALSVDNVQEHADARRGRRAVRRGKYTCFRINRDITESRDASRAVESARLSPAGAIRRVQTRRSSVKVKRKLAGGRPYFLLLSLALAV
jgi:hypothetical protein